MRRWLRTIWFVLTLRCEQADRLRAIPDRSALRRSERVAEGLHSMLCKSCRHARRQMMIVEESLRTLTDVPDTLTPDARQRIADGLNARIRNNDGSE